MVVFFKYQNRYTQANRNVPKKSVRANVWYQIHSNNMFVDVKFKLLPS